MLVMTGNPVNRLGNENMGFFSRSRMRIDIFHAGSVFVYDEIQSGSPAHPHPNLSHS